MKIPATRKCGIPLLMVTSNASYQSIHGRPPHLIYEIHPAISSATFGRLLPDAVNSRRPQANGRLRFVALGSTLGYHFTMEPTVFADELQKDWQLTSMTLLPSQTVINVHTTAAHGVPSPVGRYGLSIMSYPAIYSERDQAEFIFWECLLVRIWDEAALSIREVNPDPRFEGRTFRRYTKSALLDLHTEPPIAGFHYQLNFSNEIIDIICKMAPVEYDDIDAETV